jgi:hypothetical protein
MYRPRRRGSALDIGEIVSLVLLAVIALWGIWFGIQSMITLWFPLNLAYLLAGAVVALVSVSVARALLKR